MPKDKGKKGRPTKYRPEMVHQIHVLAESGFTNEQLSKVLGISPTTLNFWMGEYQDFLNALKDGREKADQLVEMSLFRKAIGYYHLEEKVFYNEDGEYRTKVLRHYPPDTTAAIFWLKNRKPKEWRDAHLLETPIPVTEVPSQKRTFKEFCEVAGYPLPYPKQEEMREFGMYSKGVCMILGARGYGKTDYVTILGVAYEIYLDNQFTALIVTKSEDRNAAILREISSACRLNGVQFDKENSTTIRARGLTGKDP